MRIVGGIWRGRTFEAPQGRDTRPTTDRMRESLASTILAAFDLDLTDCSVLDAFAGSGGVGLELLSRGARHCTFCERDRRTAALIQRNCKSLGASKDVYDVVAGDVWRLLEKAYLPGAPFSLVFLDPPYAMRASRVGELVGDLDKVGALGDSCVIVYERSRDGDELGVAGFEFLRSKRHGGTCVDVLKKGESL